MMLPLRGDAFAEFDHQPLWCAWRGDKAPYIEPVRKGRTNAAGPWLRRDAADGLARCFEDQGHKRVGIGVRLGVEQPDGPRLAALDLDACRDPDTGEIAGWAKEVLDAFADSYCETSPSGTGLHVFFLVNDAVLAALKEAIPVPKAGRKWRRPAPEGEKAPAIELMLGGYVTVTGAAVSSSAGRIRLVGRAALMRLVREVVPAFLGIEPGAIEQLEKPPALPAPAQLPASRTAASAGPRMFRASRSRMAALAQALDDAAFQLLMALWGRGRKAPKGWWISFVRLDDLVRLPGSDRDSRRIARTMRRARGRLERAEHLRQVRPAIPPKGDAPGKAAEYEVTAPLIHDPASGPRPDVLRVPLEIWNAMVWTLPPFPLRLFCWLWATRAADTSFHLSLGEIERVFGASQKRASAGLEALTDHGLLEILEKPDRGPRRPGRYRLGEMRRTEVRAAPTTPPPPTPPNPGRWGIMMRVVAGS